MGFIRVGFITHSPLPAADFYILSPISCDFLHKIAYKKIGSFFFENRALSLFYIYNELTSCTKAKKSNQPNSGTFRD